MEDCRKVTSLACNSLYETVKYFVVDEYHIKIYFILQPNQVTKKKHKNYPKVAFKVPVLCQTPGDRFVQW